MKRTFTLLIVSLFGTAMLFGQTSHQLESVVEGEVTYWNIDTPDDLIWLSDTLSLDADNDANPDFDSIAAKMDANYRLVADITFDLDSSNVDWNSDGTIDFATSTDNLGWFPIGAGHNELGELKQFSGTFDGQYYTIYNIYCHHIDRSGLFGRISGATIENLRIMNYRGYPVRHYNGIVAGRATYESVYGRRDIIRRCWAEGAFHGLPDIMDDDKIRASMYTGGITGRMTYGDISECVTRVTAHGETTRQRRISGMVGQLEGSSTIKNCYSVSMLTAEEQTGIILGRADGELAGAAIENCYSVGLVVGKDPRDELGNFAGNTGAVSLTSCYWDKEKHGDDVGVTDGDNIANVVGLMTADFATEANFVGWDFTDTWKMGTVDGEARPVLQFQDMFDGGGTGIKDHVNSELLISYPNPVSIELTIENAPLNAEYSMINMIGQTVESGIVTSERMMLNVENYETGLYILKVGDSVNRIMVK